MKWDIQTISNNNNNRIISFLPVGSMNKSSQTVEPTLRSLKEESSWPQLPSDHKLFKWMKWSDKRCSVITTRISSCTHHPANNQWTDSGDSKPHELQSRQADCSMPLKELPWIEAHQHFRLTVIESFWWRTSILLKLIPRSIIIVRLRMSGGGHKVKWEARRCWWIRRNRC